MEIERKYLVQKLPEDLDSFPFRELEQGYLCTDPVIRIRRDDDRYELTYKSGGLMVREEYNLPLTEESLLQTPSPLNWTCSGETWPPLCWQRWNSLTRLLPIPLPRPTGLART